MKISKKHVNYAVVPLVLGVIVVGVYLSYEAIRVELVGASATQPGHVGGAASESDTPNNATLPRNITVNITEKKPAAGLDSKAVANAVQSLGSVQRASLEGEPPTTVQLALVGPLRFSRLSELLQSQGAEIAVERSPLHGALRLHVAGMTCSACAKRLKGHLSGLEGVDVKKIDIVPGQGGQVYLAIADSTALTFTALKEVVAAQEPYQLADVEWLMETR